MIARLRYISRTSLVRQFFERHSEAALRTFLAGENLPPVLRDPSPGRVPHGLEG